MSHVDEGALHAYLDGALDEYSGGEARRIRAHLDRCPECAEALREARALRESAHAILAEPNLSPAPPPLEELKRRAGSSGVESPRARSRLYRFGWAASVVLALGVGWMLRGGADPEPGAPSTAARTTSGDRARSGTAARTEGQVTAEAPGTAEPVVTSEAEADAAAVPSPPAPLRAPTLDVTPVLAAVEVADVDVADTDEPAGTLQPPPELAYEAGDAPLTAEAEARSSEPGLALATRSDGAGDALDSRSLEALRDGLGVRSGRDETSSDPGSLVVPGLEVLSIVWREEGVVPAGVRVLQRLEDGGTLELIHLPEGFDPDGVAPPEPEQEELVVPRGEGWLILRGPVEEGVLETLLRRLDEASPSS
ncbi:MAG: zf-HC2 domain-containing protein [Gemmatimonadota bacterium]|nr:zf-HC2 domain-containing protein [Gemmatimonadota bacterium]